MRIQHNIMAMNAYRNYNTNTSALSKNLEKLSSGYKINRAGDDAAGLAISEKMRAQITGLNAASKNVKDGISLVKTAEGAMQEIQDMLNRMDYLATQSANGTYDNDVDRKNLQKEVDALKTEINRIADSANFNGIKLLDGSLAGSGTMAAQKQTLVDAAHNQLHTKGVTEQEPGFTINISQIFDGLTAASEIGANSTFTINVKVGGATIALTATASATIAKGAQIKASMVALSATATAVTIGSVDFDIAGASGGVISFTYKASGTNNAANGVVDFQSSMNVTASIVGDATLGADKYFTCKTQNVQDGVKGTPDKMAHAQFQLTEDMVKQMIAGGKLTIGTVTLEVDKTKNVASSASGKIGIKDLIDSDGNFKSDAKNLNAFADAITRAGTNSAFHISAGADNIIDLHEKAGFYSSTDTAKQLDSNAKIDALVYMSTGGGAAGSLTLQIGDTSDPYNQLSVKIGDMHTSGMNIDSVDISSITGAQNSIKTIRDAINYVSGVRGDLGATQNRLEHTANNLSVMAENIQDAESTIRDTDVAEEMMAYTKNNILIQSAQAMLAQANAVPQGVLQLLG